MKDRKLIAYLSERPQADEEALRDFDEKYLQCIAPGFRDVEKDLEANGHREYLLKGGRGSCKSSYVSLRIVKILRHDPMANALVIRKVGAYIRKSVYEQMLWALDVLGVRDEWETTVSPMELTHKVTGQKILFNGLDEPRKLKSIKLRRGYFGAVWFEEGEEYDGIEEINSVMQSAGRGKGANTVSFITYNPPKSINNWINKESLRPRADRMVHHSIYTDVPAAWLGEKFLALAESIRQDNPEAWRHEYGGEATGNGGAVFRNLELRPIGAQERLLLAPCKAGLDFGYANDPSALMTVFLRTGDQTLFILGEYYKAGAGFNALEKACRKAGEAGGVIWCDTEPRTIAELKERGCRVAAARKGKGSRMFGVEWLTNLQKIVIDPETCPNAAREFAGFEYARDARTGEWRADYQDGNDHTIDATRYACWEYIHRNRRTKFFSGKGAIP